MEYQESKKEKKDDVMKKIFMVVFAMLFSTMAFAGPVRQQVYENVVRSDSSHSYYVDVIGDGHPTLISLHGDCYSMGQDIDLWVYEGNRLIAKETDISCEHSISIDTYAGRFGTLKVVVENEQKPFDTGYTLFID